MDLPITRRTSGDHGIPVNRAWEDEAVVIVGMFADQIDPTRCPDKQRRGLTESPVIGGNGPGPRVASRHGITARSRSAACSGVRSRCASASISKPTMNLRTEAERSSGG